jgi:hypothetical protein
MRSRGSPLRLVDSAGLWGQDASLFGRRAANQLTRGKTAEALNLLVNRAQKFLQNGFKFVARGRANLGTEKSDSVVEAAREHV